MSLTSSSQSPLEKAVANATDGMYIVIETNEKDKSKKAEVFEYKVGEMLLAYVATLESSEQQKVKNALMKEDTCVVFEDSDDDYSESESADESESESELESERSDEDKGNKLRRRHSSDSDEKGSSGGKGASGGNKKHTNQPKPPPTKGGSGGSKQKTGK